MPRACLLILGFVLRFAHISGHGVGEDKCVGSACPKAGTAMLQHKQLSQQEEGLATAREDPVTYEEVGTEMRCHPRFRRLSTWFDLNGGPETPLLSKEECQAKCTGIPACKYFSMLIPNNKTNKGKCTSYTACDPTQTGVKKTTTWKKVEPPKPTCKASIGFMKNRFMFFHYYCVSLYAPLHCGSFCIPDPNPDDYYYHYYNGYCAREYCPECGQCEAVPTPAPPGCWTTTDLVQFAPNKPEDKQLKADVRLSGSRGKCGKLKFPRSYMGENCEGWGKELTVIKGDDLDFAGYFEYEDFVRCKSP